MLDLGIKKVSVNNNAHHSNLAVARQGGLTPSNLASSAALSLLAFCWSGR